MFGRFFKDSAIYALSSLMARGVMIVLVPLFTRYLEPAELGRLYLLQSAVTLVTILVGLELVQGLAREYGDAGSVLKRRRYASSALWFNAACYGVFLMLGTWFSGPLAGFLFGSEVHQPVIVAACWASVGVGIFLVVSSQLRFALRPKASAVAALVQTLSSAGGAIIFVVVFGLGVEGALWGMFLGALLGVAAAAPFIYRDFLGGIRAAYLQRMLRISMPLMPSSVAVFACLYANQWVLNALGSPDEVGYFGVMVRLASLAGIVMLGFSQALTPLIYQTHSAAETPSELARIFRVFSAAALVVLAGLCLFADLIVRILSTPEYVFAAPVLVVLLPAVVLQQCYIFAPGLWIKRRMWAVSGINIFAALASVGLNMLLAPRWGAMGAAWATLGCAAAAFLAHMIASQRSYPVPHHWGRALAGVMVVVVLVTIGRKIPGGDDWSVIYQRLPFVFAAAIAVWALGLLDWRRNPVVLPTSA
jgi:O-antigen/teichoic acid export membrane protein